MHHYFSSEGILHISGLVQGGMVSDVDKKVEPFIPQSPVSHETNHDSGIFPNHNLQYYNDHHFFYRVNSHFKNMVN